MATKRISQTAIDWKRLSKLIPQEYQADLQQHIGKNFKYVSRVTSLPDNLPKIDFEAYKKLVPEKSAIIDKFNKAYSTIQVPYPKDTENIVSKINANEQKAAEVIKEHLTKLEAISEDLKKQKENLKSVPPVEELTAELHEYYFPSKPLSDLELFGEDPHQKMLDDAKKAKLHGGKKHH